MSMCNLTPLRLFMFKLITVPFKEVWFIQSERENHPYTFFFLASEQISSDPSAKFHPFKVTVGKTTQLYFFPLGKSRVYEFIPFYNMPLFLADSFFFFLKDNSLATSCYSVFGQLFSFISSTLY